MKTTTRKRAVSLLLTLVLCLGLAVPALAETALPDWYFLFAIFKQVDANCDDGKGTTTHTTYAMTQDEVNAARDYAKQFEAFMNQVGVMRAHVDVVEIDTPVKKLAKSDYGSWIDAEQADILLKGKVDLDRYDHVFCFVTLNVSTVYMGLTGGPLENGTGESCVNFALAQKYINPAFTPAVCVHEFLHFMEQLNQKWGASYELHNIGDAYGLSQDDGKACYTDIILNRVKKGAKLGTGVIPVAWQYPPRTLRTMQELTIPSGVTSIGTWAFGNDTSLTSVSIPVSVTSIEYAAFWNTGVKEVYYAGTQAQWKSIEMGEFNDILKKAKIYYSSLMADVKVSDYFAKSVTWALEKGITTGTGNGKFSPGNTCDKAQILTFLWRANGSPKPAGSNPFSDVKSSDYYTDAATWAYEKGMVSGKTFSGNDPCTRSMAVTYIWKAAGSPAANAASFTDVAAGADYAQAVGWAVAKNITNGTGDGKFSPDATCTRGQIVTLLYQAQAK